MDTTAPDPNSARQRRRRAEKRRRISAADTLGEILLVAVVLASAVGIGAVHPPVLLGISALAIVGGVASMMTFRSLPRPVLVLLTLAGFSAFQALPLPAELVSHLSPASADVWLRSLIPFGQKAPRMIPLSIDPGASLAEALKLVTYAATYLLANRVRVRRGASWLAILLFGSSVLVSLITLVHGVADLDVLYGVYHPDFAVGRWHVGPLLNSNNFAGYSLLGLSAGAGLLLAGRSSLPRAPTMVGLVIVATGLCLSGSRAGLLSAAAGGCVVVLWLILVRQVRFNTRRTLLGLAPIVGGIAFAFALGTQKEWNDLTSVDAHRKVVVWGWSLPMIRDHFFFGVGRGAFETGFSPYRNALDYDWTAVVTHAENFVVQWVAEWGVPVGVCAAIVIVGYIVREWIAVSKESLSFLAMTGLVTLFLQNLADLGLEIPAIAIGAVVALAAGERVASRTAEETKERIGLRALPAALPALGIWFAALALSMSPVESLRSKLSLVYRELPVKSADERAQFRELLHDAIVGHPGESFFPLLGGLVAARAQDENPLPWVSRALELAPVNGRVHLVLAEILASHGAIGQAMLHLRFAAQYDRTLQGPASALAVRLAPSLDVLMAAVPDGTAGDTMLVDACAREAQPALKIDCFRRATARNADNAVAQDELAQALLAALAPPSWPCSGSSMDTCIADADRAIRAMAKADPHSWRPGYLMSRLMLARGDVSGAAQLLARVCPPNAEGDDCARDAVGVAIKSGSDEAIAKAASAYAARPCDSSETCASSLEWLAGKLEAGGKLALAVSYYTKAAELDPTAARWLKIADRAAQAQLTGVARSALDRAGRSPDATPQLRAQRDDLMQRLAGTAALGSP